MRKGKRAAEGIEGGEDAGVPARPAADPFVVFPEGAAGRGGAGRVSGSAFAMVCGGAARRFRGSPLAIGGRGFSATTGDFTLGGEGSAFGTSAGTFTAGREDSRGRTEGTAFGVCAKTLGRRAWETGEDSRRASAAGGCGRDRTAGGLALARGEEVAAPVDGAGPAPGLSAGASPGAPGSWMMRILPGILGSGGAEATRLIASRKTPWRRREKRTKYPIRECSVTTGKFTPSTP